MSRTVQVIDSFYSFWATINIGYFWGGSPGLVVMGGDSVVGSNPSTIYWMDIFTLICSKNCIGVSLRRMLPHQYFAQ